MKRRMLRLLVFLLLCSCSTPGRSGVARRASRWVAEVFTLSPTPFETGWPSGARVPGGPFAGQPVQGFSALVTTADGGLWTVTDNGYGAQANSADFRPGVFALSWGDGGLQARLVAHLEDHGAPLTGADVDPESLVVADDGTWWVGDELGPSLLHFDARGQLLARFRVPDGDGGVLRSVDAPERTTVLRAMQQLSARTGTRVVSPAHALLADKAQVDDLHAAGFTVIPWTVNDVARMRQLVGFGVDGLITDRPDLALALDAGVEVQGHRGARGLAAENTLAAFARALELGVPTLELDLHLLADGQLAVWHDPVLTKEKCRGPVPLELAKATARQLAAFACSSSLSPGAPPPDHPITFAQLLTFLDGWQQTHPGRAPPRLNVETKGTTAGEVLEVRRRLLAALAHTPWEARATLQSFVFDSLGPGPLPTVALFEAGAPPPFTLGRSSGFENLARTPDGRTLYAMLEKPDLRPRELRAFAFDLEAQRFEGLAFRFPLDARATAIADLTLLDATHGLALERDDGEGPTAALKQLVAFTLPATPGGLVTRGEVIDLLHLETPDGRPFAFSFTTPEGVARLPDGRLAVVADDNYPFGRARHPGGDVPDDTELILLHAEP